MKTLTVALPGREYDIHIGRGLFARAGEYCKRVLPRAVRLAVVTDSNVGRLYGTRLLKNLEDAGFHAALYTVPAGETSKSMENLGALYDFFMDVGLTRTDAVIALGGGVVGDLAGFAAATILRGVDFIQIPTTLLAQVDSSVGGKVGIDLRAGKNLAGVFWQPKLVLMDPDCLNTLGDAVFFDGMAEVIKYGCIKDPAFYSFLEQRPGRAKIMVEIEHVLYTCCDLKRQVVLSDERDTGERMLLNFGHTMGHAYELAGGYKTWTHGQAVAAGMIKALELGTYLGVTPPGLAERVGNLLGRFGLPLKISCGKSDYAAAIGLDKKGSAAQIFLILLKKIGCAVSYQMEKSSLLDMLDLLEEKG